jgi:nitrite reductase/ring-hydroxylating ferredoxin subunit
MSFVEVAQTTGIPAGTMKHVETGGKEICIINVGGTFYAIGDRCPHMSAPLSMGKLDGSILTCPLHFSRFDVRTGRKISEPVEPQIERMDILPPPVTDYIMWTAAITATIKTADLEVFPVRVEGTAILVDI